MVYEIVDEFGEPIAACDEYDAVSEILEDYCGKHDLEEVKMGIYTYEGKIS